MLAQHINKQPGLRALDDRNRQIALLKANLDLKITSSRSNNRQTSRDASRDSRPMACANWP
jgi:hypothetical protein